MAGAAILRALKDVRSCSSAVLKSGCGALLGGFGGNLCNASLLRTFDQAGEVIAVGAVTLEGFFVKQALNAATEANLV